MILKFSSVVKKTLLKFSKLTTKNVVFQTIKDVVFPPLCQACNDESCYTLFCKECWLKCSFIDPVYRCFCCFKESEGLCYECMIRQIDGVFRAAMFISSKPSKLLTTIDPDITASFIILFWDCLGWQWPDLFISDPSLAKAARRLSKRLNVPMMEVKDLFLVDFSTIEQRKIIFLTLNFSLDNFYDFASKLSAHSKQPKYIFSLFECFL